MLHSGRNLIFLLMALGVADRTSATVLMNKHRTMKVDARAIVAPEIRLAGAQKRWATFVSAAHVPQAVDYMRDVRGFPDADDVCRRYDLRCATEGVWAQRVLMPIYANGQLITWHGRSMRGSLEPKYLAQADGSIGATLLYVPGDAQPPPGSRLIIVEGQMDALKIAAARVPGTYAAALTGKAMGPEKVMRLRQLGQQCAEIGLSLDPDAGLAEAMRILAELRGAGLPQVKRKLLPEALGYKDVGDMPYHAITKWIGHSA